MGRFLAEEVECVILPEVASNATPLLGGSFLQHYIVKLDPVAGQLHLTEIRGNTPAKSTTQPSRPNDPFVSHD